ncbi:MAG: hypothetical protein EAZ95_20660 [Bacteroidetes bacterium]|nr:MAG: hypothetical protein EAZ95_20660 [Bacteroidota bacterium]
MKKYLFVFVALVWAVTFAQAQKTTATETRDLPTFSKVKSGSIIEVVLKKSNTESAKITTENIEPSEVITEVRGGELCLELQNGKYRNNIKVVVEVYYKNLNGIKVSGAGSLTAEGTIKSETLHIRLSGAGSIKLESVEALKLTSDISGAGSIKIVGKADDHFVEVSGAGNFKGFELSTLNTHARISGAGNVDINVTGNLEGRISGAGNLRYKGNPKNKDLERSGAGSARAVE